MRRKQQFLKKTRLHLYFVYRLVFSGKLRGAITKKKRENLGKIPKGGEGEVENTDENSQFQFGNFENPGGSLDFLKNV